jgi:CubicO group peptidase (beta-lactamase class C family)
MKRQHFFLGGAALSTSLLAKPKPARAVPDYGLTVQRLEAYLNGLCKTHKVPSASFAILQNGQIYYGSVGVQSLSSRLPVRWTTCYQACSCSKMIAAITGVILAEQGAVKLDGDLTTTLMTLKVPNSSPAGSKPVTLRRLFGMTGGANIHGYGGYPMNVALPTMTEILNGKPPANSPAVKIVKLPGTVEAYSGGGYELARAVMQGATNRTLAQLAQGYIFNKLGMTRSGYLFPPETSSGIDTAFAYSSSEVEYGSQFRRYPEQAAAGLWTTPTDFMKFAKGLSASYNGTPGAIMSQQSAQQVFTNVDGKGYGIGGALTRKYGIVSYGKDGANAGYTCYFILFPAQGKAAAIMTNSDNGYPLFAPFFQWVTPHFGWPYYPGLAD